jgi:preprotein translocase subunit SecA
LEDNLMALFGGTDRIAGIMDRLNFEEGEVIQHPWVTKSLERAQKKVEQNNFSIRKRQLEYDDVLNNQRNVIYSRRRNALLGENLQSDILDMLEDLVGTIVETHYKTADYHAIQEEILRNLAVDVPVDEEAWMRAGEDGLIDLIVESALHVYRLKEERIAQPLYQALTQLDAADPDRRPDRIQVLFTDGTRRLRIVADVRKALDTQGREIVRALERAAILAIIDDRWMEHLRDLDSVKEGIGLRAFGQKDPLVEYKREAFGMFRDLMEEVQREAITLIWKSVPEAAPEAARPQAARSRQAGVDMSRAQARHADSTNMGFSAPQSTMPAGAGMGSAGIPAGGGRGPAGMPSRQGAPGSAGAQAALQQRRPETAGDEPGRNDHVTIRNVSTGETRETKWKHAKRMVEDEGWVLMR